MRPPLLPRPENLAAAGKMQRDLAERVVLEGDLSGVKTLAALDASIKQGEALVGVAVLWEVATEQVLEVGAATVDATEVFPYVSGFLSFREAPVYLAALAQLSTEPDLLLVDGQGVAHPRGLGIAAHLGVHLDIASIGVAKSRLYGKEAGVLDEEAGRAVPLVSKGAQIGWVYRSRTGVKPLYLSPGHRVGMAETLSFVQSLPGKTKLPEPLKRAHDWAGKARKEGLTGRLELS
ncbi:endonuclease V [soil metagenome]